MNESSFVPQAISKLLVGAVSPVDLFVRLSEDKFIKVVRSGDPFDKDRLRNYRSREVDEVYILKTDFNEYVELCLGLLRRLVDNSEKGVAQDFTVSFRVSEIAFDHLRVNGATAETLGPMETLGVVLSDQMSKRPKLVGLTDDLLMMHDNLAKQSVGTAVLTAMILHGLRWQLKKNLEATILAGLLQDIALAYDPEPYETHPLKSADLLLKSGALSDPRVADIVREHHELPDGSGFPVGHTGSEIFSMALPVIMANRLCQLMLDPDSHLMDRSVQRAIRYLKNREEGFYPVSYWDALGSWKS